MQLIDRLALFAPLDIAALVAILVLWQIIGWWIERPSESNPSLSHLMAGYRREWMLQMLTRVPRIFDSQTVGSLRQGTSFFGSASMIAIGGIIALIGNTDRLSVLATELTIDRVPTFVWEVKLLLLLGFITNAFLKFVWSNRLFGYCSVLMAAVPNDPTDPLARVRAGQAAEICITAARSFNRGLRATYFGLGSVGWFFGPGALLFTTALTVAVLWRREFRSHSRVILLQSPPNEPDFSAPMAVNTGKDAK